MRNLIIALLFSLLAMPAAAQVGAPGSLSDPNLADREALIDLPHVNDGVAAAILDGRPYLTATQLDQTLAAELDVDQRQALYARMFRQIDLNGATREEIMLIPGMSTRMAHEFEEYRPYRSLEQFRREIGKYVDEAELARLEQYVFIPMDLNSARAEDFATIPGMSPRMIHEFEEYRPYASMAQFRREIGKYVDADEVARLESYVTLE